MTTTRQIASGFEQLYKNVRNDLLCRRNAYSEADNARTVVEVPICPFDGMLLASYLIGFALVGF